MIVRTAIEVNLDDGRKEYVDYKVYNIIRRGGYLQGRKDAIDEFAERLSNWCVDECFTKSIDGVEAELFTLDGITDMIFELAEKLKEKKDGG